MISLRYKCIIAFASAYLVMDTFSVFALIRIISFHQHVFEKGITLGKWHEAGHRLLRLYFFSCILMAICWYGSDIYLDGQNTSETMSLGKINFFNHFSRSYNRSNFPHLRNEENARTNPIFMDNYLSFRCVLF